MKKMQVAKARDLFYWLGSFYVIAGLGMVSGFARYSAYIYNFNAKIENTTPETRKNIDVCNKQDKKASRDRPPPPSYICGRLPSGPGLRHQAQQDQVSGKQHNQTTSKFCQLQNFVVVVKIKTLSSSQGRVREHPDVREGLDRHAGWPALPFFYR